MGDNLGFSDIQSELLRVAGEVRDVASALDGHNARCLLSASDRLEALSRRLAGEETSSETARLPLCFAEGGRVWTVGESATRRDGKATYGSYVPRERALEVMDAIAGLGRSEFKTCELAAELDARGSYATATNITATLRALVIVGALERYRKGFYTIVSGGPEDWLSAIDSRPAHLELV